MDRQHLILHTQPKTLVELTTVGDAGSMSRVNNLPKPNAQQLAFQELELGLFIHFGMNTFSGEGTGGCGTHPPERFNPTALDCDNWMEVAKAMGARFAVLTARHEEGFCLWPTSTTDYSVRSSPYKNGQGDVVAEFVAACRRYGIKPCLYHPSYMDAHHIFRAGDPIRWHREWFSTTNQRLAEPGAAERFTAMQATQIRELLTNYGEITYLWMDHMGETQGILDPQAVDAFWTTIAAEARKHQPECLMVKADVFFSRDTGGFHCGRAANAMWYRCRRQNTGEGQGDPIPDPEHGDHYVVQESNTVFSGGWFWCGPEVKPVDDMVDHYLHTVGRGSTFLPNFAPDPRGLMTDVVLNHAREFGRRIRQFTENSIAHVGPGGAVVEVTLPSATAIERVVVSEDLREGQKIAAYVIEARVPGGSWLEIARGESIGHKRIVCCAPIVAEAIRFTCTRSFAALPVIRSLAVFATK